MKAGVLHRVMGLVCQVNYLLQTHLGDAFNIFVTKDTASCGCSWIRAGSYRQIRFPCLALITGFFHMEGSHKGIAGLMVKRSGLFKHRFKSNLATPVLLIKLLS